MTITTKKRTQLKSYFVKNAIPTEANFADLVDAQLNQADDGVFKLPGEPLSVVAAVGGQKRVLRLYGEYPATNADWLISLNPAQNPADPNSSRPGFGIADGAGNTRFFIDPDGKAGIGTNTPADKLTVREGDIRIEGGRYRRLKIVSDQYWAGIELVARQDGEAGHPHIDFTHGNLDTPNFGIRVVGSANNVLAIQSGDGTANLDVQGNVTISGNTHARKVVVNNSTNTGVDRGLWLWGPGDSNHVIYSAAPGPAGTSPANKPAIKGFFDGNHRMRFRTATGQGFLFENNAEAALVDIDSDTGNLWTLGAVYTGNSDIYFTRTDHKHTAIGNAQGYAAIENAVDYNALMILGRATPSGRIVKLWDLLQVNGKLEVTGDVTFGSTISTAGRMHINGGEICYILNKNGVIIGKEWGGNGNLSVQGSKNFHINHPLDPSRYLVHSVIEGPEAAVLYRGEAQLSDGVCEVELPVYFEALTRPEERTVQITPKIDGQEISGLAAGEVVDGRFAVRAIDGRNRSQRFYWEVKAVRADIDRIEVEPLKSNFPTAPNPSRQ